MSKIFFFDEGSPLLVCPRPTAMHDGLTAAAVRVLAAHGVEALRRGKKFMLFLRLRDGARIFAAIDRHVTEYEVRNEEIRRTPNGGCVAVYPIASPALRGMTSDYVFADVRTSRDYDTMCSSILPLLQVRGVVGLLSLLRPCTLLGDRQVFDLEGQDLCEPAPSKASPARVEKPAWETSSPCGSGA